MAWRSRYEVEPMPNFLWIMFFLCVVFVAPLRAELLVLEVVVNEMSRGEFFVERDEQGHFWLPVDQANALGLLISPGKIVEKSGVSYFSFDEFPTIAAKFDELPLPRSIFRKRISISPENGGGTWFNPWKTAPFSTINSTLTRIRPKGGPLTDWKAKSVSGVTVGCI